MASRQISAEEIKGHILAVNPAAEPYLQSHQTDLLGEGALDSFALVALIDRLEEKLDGFIFNYTDLRAVHFRTVESVLQLLTSNYGFVDAGKSLVERSP